MKCDDAHITLCCTGSDRCWGIVNVVLTLIVAGIALWAINTFIPRAQRIKTILNCNSQDLTLHTGPTDVVVPVRRTEQTQLPVCALSRGKGNNDCGPISP